MIEPTPLLGVIQIIALLVMCVMGIHIAISLGIVGLIAAILYYANTAYGFQLTGLTTWSHINNYTLSMIPLFVLMGLFIAESGLGGESYECFYKWLARIPGGLASATQVTCALFGCVTGSTASTIAAIGSIANPEMKKHGYSADLRFGSIITAGTLAVLIPPSIPAIIYCILTEESVGIVFIAGIVPGIVLMALYIITILIWVFLRPQAAPVFKGSFTWKERFISLKGPVPILMVFIVLVWGIYTGVFSATEAAGIGCFVSLAMCLVYRRVNRKMLKGSMVGAIRITAMIQFIVIGAFLFTHTLAQTGFSRLVGTWVIGASANPTVGIFLIILVFLVTGCFLDVFAMQVLFIPLFYPVVKDLGFSGIWFGTLCVVLTEIALMTPPIAANIFIANQLEPEVPITTIIRGVVPFYGAAIGICVLLVFFPQMALWLPGTMTR